ncbi:unnamed protein product [Mytilus coruscus]|uniref:Integrase catalytic domain-containing protein n=1 Tax=Mytilus coruscus TaxID=42192 RepID=A0A6J8BPT4_MYTCO|nr:unnamed protein product [Mytilus coruscus]
MGQDIEDKVKACGLCAQHQSLNAKERMLMPEIPERPWSKLATDLFEYQKQHYLLVVDYYSKWPEVMKLDNETSKNTIDYLKGLMSRFGYIDELVSDNGPQFSSLEFKRFATEYGFKHTTSSPHYAQSNEQAERSVQTIKKLILESKDPHKALLDHRNTPLDIDLSPAQLFLNRRLKTSLPTSLPFLMPQNINNREIIKKLEIRQRKAKPTMINIVDLN